jgi:hypothetical protein
MMFTLLQEQHKVHLEAMVVANKQAMDAMLERMNALIAGQGKAADKPTATVPNTTQAMHPTLQTGRKSLYKLRKACLSQTANLLQARVQCKQALPRMKIKKSCLCDGLTGTRDVK